MLPVLFIDLAFDTSYLRAISPLLLRTNLGPENPARRRQCDRPEHGTENLSDAGYEVITVNNGSAALKKVSEQAPDLIVLDVYMPGYGGLEVCQRLKEVAETARIPILLSVGKLEPFKPEEARRVRADAFIIKPFEATELLAALTKLEDKIVPLADAATAAPRAGLRAWPILAKILDGKTG